MNNYQLILNKSQVGIYNDFDLTYIENYKSKYLVPVRIFTYNEEIEYDFELNNDYFLSEFDRSNMIDNYRLALKIGDLINSITNVRLNIDINNIVVNDLLEPRILFRDMGSNDPYYLLFNYKVIIAFLLTKEQDISNIYNLGDVFLNKNKITKGFIKCNSIGECIELLQSQLSSLIEDNNQKRLVDIDKLKYNRFIFILMVIFVFCSSFILFLENKDINILNNKNNMQSSFINKNYVETITYSKNLKFKNLSKEDKYIISLAAIETANFSNEQKANAMSNISVNGDEKILNYWTYIAWGNYDQAYNVAMQLDGVVYQGYALYQKKISIENDTSLSADEKNEKIKTIEQQLKEIGYGE